MNKCPKTGTKHEYHAPRKGSSVKVCIWCNRFKLVKGETITAKTTQPATN
jgi:hypothetical protein